MHALILMIVLLLGIAVLWAAAVGWMGLNAFKAFRLPEDQKPDGLGWGAIGAALVGVLFPCGPIPTICLVATMVLFIIVFATRADRPAGSFQVAQAGAVGMGGFIGGLILLSICWGCCYGVIDAIVQSM